MENKGYTIIEAVVAMFLVVVMVGAVFSALMSGRRAITSSSEREEVLYSLQSAYGMLKDCRSNPDCHLNTLNCSSDLNVNGQTYQNLKACDALFTFNFRNLCKKSADNNFLGYRLDFIDNISGVFYTSVTASSFDYVDFNFPNFEIVSVDANCTED